MIDTPADIKVLKDWVEVIGINLPVVPTSVISIIHDIGYSLSTMTKSLIRYLRCRCSWIYELLGFG